MISAVFRVCAGAVLLGALIGVGPAALAGNEAGESPSPAEIQKAEDDNPKICKRFKPTGSNISKNYCFRKKTWDAMREDGQRTMRDISDRASVNTSSGEGPR